MQLFRFGRLSMISIHAPAKGATIAAISVWAVEHDFNPRSREGSDQPQTPLHRPRRDFNPRSREGSDVFLLLLLLVRRISIHAPAKGATSAMRQTVSGRKHFNPRSREGSDVFPDKAHGKIYTFQSTLPRRERQLKIKLPSGILKFQSTLPRRERLWSCSHFSNEGYFNPRSREGSDRLTASAFRLSFNFNPRSREGSDAFECRATKSDEISIHAPAKGATTPPRVLRGE